MLGFISFFFFFFWKKKSSTEKLRDVEVKVVFGSSSNTPTLHLPMSPPYPSCRLSPELQYEINIGPAGNERSPQEIEEGGKVEKETKEK